MLFRLFGKDSAFKVHDFRLFFYGQAISSVGNWLQSAALGWLIFDITKSDALVGVNAALLTAPAILLAPIAGLLIDRFKTKHVLGVTTTLGMCQATALLAVTLHHPTIRQINLLTLVLGFVSSFDGPARQTSIAEIVHNDDNPSATGLNSTLVSMGVMVGTALAGTTIWVAEKLHLPRTGLAFALNVASYVPVIITLTKMKFAYASVKNAEVAWGKLLPGFRYVFAENKSIRTLLMMIFVTMTFAFPYRALMPAIVKVQFNGSAATFALLGAMPGVGALLGGIFVSRFSKRYSLKVLVTYGLALIGACLIGFSVAPNVCTAIPLTIGAGFGAITASSRIRSKIQVLADRTMLGRISGFNMMMFLGGISFGNAAIGQLAQACGLTVAIATCGFALLGVAAFLVVKPSVLNFE